jgi:hypothetical protein
MPPDPSSQSVCTIGGNVAGNAGGAHCLKYDFTTTHVLVLDVVPPLRRTGDASTAGGAMRAGMDIGIYEQRHDWPNMGPSLLIGAFLILAVRTVTWPPRAWSGTTSDRELDVEIENAIISWATYLAVLTLAFERMTEPST